MSHCVLIKAKIKNLSSLKEACKVLGLEFRENQKTFTWWGRSVGDFPLPKNYTAADMGKCTHAIGIPDNKNAYEVGVVPSKSEVGSWELLFDFYGGGKGLMDKIGENASKLVQEYSAQEHLRFFKKNKMKVTRKTNEKGQIVFIAQN